MFALPGLLALIPHAAAPVVGFAGLCALIQVLARRSLVVRGKALYFAALLIGLVVWGGVSACWSLVPGHSLVMDSRLLGLVVAGLSLAVASGIIEAPRRLSGFMLAGTALGLVVAATELETGGGISQFISVRPFAGTKLNQLAVWSALMAAPVAALLFIRGQHVLGVAAGLVMAAAVYLLQDTTAKMAFTVGVPCGVALWFCRGRVARVIATGSVAAILLAPLVLPRLGHDWAIFSRVDTFKESAGHRLLIWAFVGDHIAQHPLRGWGLDASRAIPGGKVEIRHGETWLPLHPHNTALQLWLELGVIGAAIGAAFIGGLWWRLAVAPWPRLYAAAAGASLAVAQTVTIAGWGLWEEWWLATLIIALFMQLVMARIALTPNSQTRAADLGAPSTSA